MFKSKIIYIFQEIGILRQPKIFILGDSHAFSFTHQKSRIIYMGPRTAHQLFNKNVETHLKTIKDKKEAIIIFIFGEIDCRIHIFSKYMDSKKKLSLNFLVSQTVFSYVKAIIKIRAIGYNVAALSIVPSGNQPNIYGYKYYATEKTRQKITKIFNQKLQEACAFHKIRFINIFNQLTDDQRIDRIHFKSSVFKYLASHIFP